MAMAGTVFAEPASASPIKLGFIGIGGRGSYHLDCALGIAGVEVVALCDIDDQALYKAKRWVEEAGQPTPHLYGDSRTAFRHLCEQETLDCVICCTPWEYHAPVCVAAMKNGKNAVSEVPIILTLDEAWEVVETHEKTGKWATMGLEGYGDLNLLNLVRKGILGDVLHAEGGYVHDLRMVQYNPLQEPWRLNHSLTRNGNLYPDHPMARILRLLDINHGDRFDSLVSMRTKSVSLARNHARLKYGENGPYANAKFAQGDVNVTLLHTAEGKVCTLNFDTSTPHPREFFRLQCVKGVYQTGVSLPAPQRTRSSRAVNQPRPLETPGAGRGGMLYIEGRSPEEDLWESAEPYFKEFQHPYLKTYAPTARKPLPCAATAVAALSLRLTGNGWWPRCAPAKSRIGTSMTPSPAARFLHCRRSRWRAAALPSPALISPKGNGRRPNPTMSFSRRADALSTNRMV